MGTTDDYDNNTGYMTFYGALRMFADIVALKGGNNAIVVCSNALQRSNQGENYVGLTLLVVVLL